MKVAVTGATGFVGTRLVASLLDDGHEVHALLQPAADPEPLIRRGVHLVPGDVRDFAAVERVVTGADVVYHLAAVVAGAAVRASCYHAVNVGGTENVVRAALSARVRHLVHCSSVAVHGAPQRIPADEDAPLMPVNAYQRTKLDAERVVERGVHEHGLSAVIARLTALYGPGDRTGVKLYRDVARGRVVMVGAGERRCHLTYVDDAVAGLRLCAEHAPSAGERFILGGDDHPTVNELVNVIAQAVRGRDGDPAGPRIIRLPAAPFAIAATLYRALLARFAPAPGIIDRLDFFLADRVWDVTRARRELGFRPRMSLREGIERTLASYREMRVV